MEALQQFQRHSRLLSFNAKQRVKQVLPLYLDRARTAHDPHSLYRTALVALKLRFPRASEVNEMDLLRTQTAMARQSQVIQTLSNLMKKVSSTSDSIIQNLK